MRKHTAHPLVYVLLTWTTIISIIQFGFLAFFFTAGRDSLSPNSSAVEPQHKKIQHTPKDKHLLGKGKMVSFKAETDNQNITWVAVNNNSDLISQSGDVLIIQLDGYYYLNFRVTLTSNVQTTHRVTLNLDKEVLLEGEINKNTISTGLLGKVRVIAAEQKLQVTIHPAASVNKCLSVTHLDIIYMEKPW